MLGGTFSHNVDDKGRVIVPAKYKKDLGVEFIITAGLDEGSLMIMSYEEWEKFLGRFDPLPIVETRRLKRYFLGSMHEVGTDKQGRMQIPQQLREAIGITDEVIFVGSGEWAEIWTPEGWDKEDYNLDNSKIIGTMSQLRI